MAQELITCDLQNCVKPVQQFCNSCQVGLCAGCINKHVNSLKSMKHDIVSFRNRTVPLVYSQCTSHSNKRCEAHCQQCNVPVCMKCVTDSHQGHVVVDMADIIAREREHIKKETEEIENSIIPKNKSCDENVEKKISKSETHYSDLEKDAKDLRKKWHLEVDNIFDTLESLIQSLRNQEISILNSCQSQLRIQNSKMTQTVQENKEIQRSNNVSDVNNYKSKLTEFRAIPRVPDVRSPSLKTNTVQGKEFSLELANFKAKLTRTTLSQPNLADEVLYSSIEELLKNAKVIANISTGIKNLSKVACVGSNRAWINGNNKNILSVDLHGTVTDTVFRTCRITPYDITVNKNGELIYSDVVKRTVNIVRDRKIETLITTPQHWHPMGLCCTNSGDILVSMRTTDRLRLKIVRYQGQKITQEIEEDECSNSIYEGGKSIMSVMENNNGDIVASDCKANAVVVVDRMGKVRFRYKGKPPGVKKSFDPTHIVTDSMGHIIVGDQSNNCLHILDQDGKLITPVDNWKLNDKPYGLSLDSEGRLWVGLYSSGEVKVIKYM